MTLKESLDLAAYRLRALAQHMPSEWQQKVALGWADDALAAGSRRAKTPKAVECEASQSGGDSRNAQSEAAHKEGS